MPFDPKIVPGQNLTSTQRAIMRDDRVLPEVRWIAACIPPFLIAAFIILYLWPGDTDKLFAWTIKSPMTAMFIGAGYVSGIYFFVLAVVGNRWHRVAAGFPAISVFTWFMGLATFLHWDKFNQSHVSFWIWLGLYVVTPFLVPAMWLRNRPTDPGTPEPIDLVVPQSVRLAAGVIGALLLVLSLLFFAWPDLMIQLWPWKLTPLTARVLCGWLALPGVLQLVLSIEPRWSAWRTPVESQIISVALILIAGVRAFGEFDRSKLSTPIIAAGALFWFVLIVLLEIMMARRRLAATNSKQLEVGATHG